MQHSYGSTFDLIKASGSSGFGTLGFLRFGFFGSVIQFRGFRDLWILRHQRFGILEHWAFGPKGLGPNAARCTLVSPPHLLTPRCRERGVKV